MRRQLVGLVVTGTSVGVRTVSLPLALMVERTGIAIASTARTVVTSCIGDIAEGPAMKAAIIADIPFMRRLRSRK